MTSPTTLRSVQSGSAAAEVPAAAPAFDTAILRQANAALDVALGEPGVKELLAKNAGAILKPMAGDVATSVDFFFWTHSKRSGGMSQEPFKELVVAWKVDPTGSIDFGRNGRVQGKIIGVFRVDQMGTPAAAYDNGWDYPKPLRVTTYGRMGQPAEVRWAVLKLDARGEVVGAGFPEGWHGRSWSGRYGTNGKTDSDGKTIP